MYLQQRILNYEKETGWEGTLWLCKSTILGLWVMGNDYRVKSGYYGGYPATYLRRVKSLFPDKKKVLHLFSGKVDLEIMPGHTVDIGIHLKPTYVDDAQSLKRVPLKNYDLVLADPPI